MCNVVGVSPAFFRASFRLVRIKRFQMPLTIGRSFANIFPSLPSIGVDEPWNDPDEAKQLGELVF